MWAFYYSFLSSFLSDKSVKETLYRNAIVKRFFGASLCQNNYLSALRNCQKLLKGSENSVLVNLSSLRLHSYPKGDKSTQQVNRRSVWI